MKKFLTLSVAALAGFASFASFGNTHETKLSAKEVLEKLSSSDIQVKYMEPREDMEKAVSTEDETRAPLWNDIGTGYFQDGIVAPMFIQEGYNVTVQHWEVQIQESAKVPGTYRIVNPYMGFDTAEYGDLTYDMMGDHHMIIHTETYEGQDYIWIEDFGTGMIIEGFGEIKCDTQAAGLFNANWPMDQILNNIQDVFCSLDKEKGVISCPTYLVGPFQNPETGAVTMEKMFNFLCYAGANQQLFWGGNIRSCPFMVVLPGNDFPKPEDPFEIYTYYGEGEFSNNFLTSVFKTAEPPVTKVGIYENPDNGRLIVKNAWENWCDEGQENTPFSLEVSVPYCIIVPDQYVGADVAVDESGVPYPVYVMSESYQFAAQGGKLEDFLSKHNDLNIYLDYDAKRIVFPAMSMLPCFPYNDRLYGFPRNENYAYESYLTLPDEYLERFAGVKDIFGQESIDGPVKYYNLQGVEVANPEKGQLVIKRQGSKTSKMIVR